MINEKEIKKQLEQKQQELKEIQQQYDEAKYAKQLQAVSGTITKSPVLLAIIKDNDLSGDDAEFLAQKVVKNLNGIFNRYHEEIQQNQQRRAKKNEARNEARKARRAGRRAAATSGNEPVTTSLQSSNTTPAKSDVASPAKPAAAARPAVPTKPTVQSRSY